MLMFGLFEMIFPVVFLTVFAMVLFTFIRGIAEWNKNNHSPRLTVPAKDRKAPEHDASQASKCR